MSAILSVSCAQPLPNVDESGSSTTTMSTLSTSSTSPSDGASVTTIDPDTTATTTEGVTETTSVTPVDCMEPNGELGDDCPPDRPFCVDEVCVACTNPAVPTCAEAMAPGGNVCDASGACVMCNEEDATECSGAGLVCDPMTNVCVVCTEHSQCEPSACNFFEGRCVEGDVLTVGVDQPDLTSAVMALGGAGGTLIVNQDTYDEAVVVSGGTIAFLAESGQTPVWQRTLGLGAPQLRVTGGATVLIDGIDVRNNSSLVDPALRVDAAGSRLWVDRSSIVQNDGVAVSDESGAEVVLRNCFVGGVVDLPALSITGSSLELRYTTVGASLASAVAIACDGASTVTVSDSIVLSRGDGPEIVCPPLVATRSASNTPFPNGMNNVAVDATMTGWFASYNTGDFHLSASGQDRFMEIAEWNDGDPAIDIDGDPRSGVDETPEHAGADFIP